ncbi:MAG: ECF RNA polymerase sigma factor SigK [Actinobacteria bacterium]|nr:ECF RNA polymerase sigma factor SigK [Actinomycetota bacterium]
MDGTSPLRADVGDRNVVGRSDVELLGRVALGDQQAFAALYDRHCRNVYGLVLGVVRDRAHAEEVTQEVFVQAWRTAARYDPARGTPGTWLRTLAHRRAVDRVRSEQAARDRDRRASAVNGTVVPVDPVADDVELLSEYAAVRSALAALTDLQREAVTLAYFGGHTYRRVAELLGVPTPTAKSRIRDGLVRLRDALETSSTALA